MGISYTFKAEHEVTEMLFLRLVLITKVPLTLISLRKYLGKQRQVMILLQSYRSAIVFDGSENPAIIGGCRRSYNYNARDYSTGALLKPLERSIVLDNSITTYDDPELLFQDKNIKIPMDIRDWGIQRDISFVLSSNSSNYSITYLAGGILENGKVSTQILSITPNFPSIIKKVETISETTFFPNSNKQHC